MAGINKWIGIGRLGKNPEVRQLSGGSTVANFSIAVSESWKDKTTGEKKEQTEWINIVAFGRLAEICGEYLKKGKEVFVEGKLKTDSYEKDGSTRYSTKVIAHTMQMLGGRQDSRPQETPQPITRDGSDIPF